MLISQTEKFQPLRYQALILVMLRMDLRAHEVEDLSFDDIDRRFGTVRVHGKACQSEYAPLPACPFKLN